MMNDMIRTVDTLWTVVLWLVPLRHALAHGTCGIGTFDQYTQWLGTDGVLKFPVSQYEREFDDNIDMHFYSPNEYMDKYLMLHSCPGTETPDHLQNTTYGCNHCAATQVYSCYGAELTDIRLPYNYHRTPLIAFRMTFVNVATLRSYGFAGLDVRFIKIQFSGVREIEAKAFQGIINLNSLSITRNDMASLGSLTEVFSGLHNLTTLHLDYNMIREWDSKDDPRSAPTLPRLETLSMNGNPLSDLDANSFRWLARSPLKYLSLRECRLHTRSADVFTALKDTLEFLDLGGAIMEGRSLRDLLWSLNPRSGNQTTLRGLSLSNLGLTAIPGREMKPILAKVKYLSLRGNNFKILKIMNITCNKHNEDGRFDTETFLPPMPELLELDLQDCQIKVIRTGAFATVPKLEILALGHNELYHFEPQSFWNLNSVWYLDLSFNHQDPFSPPLFGYIYEPESLHFEDLPNLTVLDFSHAAIGHLRLGAFDGLGKSLKNLSLCYIGICTLEYGVFENLTGLEFLDLAGNANFAAKFSADLFKGLHNLRHLQMSDCNLDFRRQSLYGTRESKPARFDDPFRHFGNLEVLNLTDNGIKYLSDVAFQSLKRVQVIDMGSNRILSWTAPVFSKNPYLKSVNLSRNRISFMTETMLREFATMERLDLSENPFLCDCYITPFLKLASNYENYTEVNSNLYRIPTTRTEEGPLILPTSLETKKRHHTNTLLNRDTIANNVNDFLQENLRNDPILSDILNTDQIAVIKTFMSIDVSDLPSQSLYVVNLEYLGAYTCLDTYESRYIAFTSTNETYCIDHELENGRYGVGYLYDPAVTIAVTFAIALAIGIVLFIIYRQRWHIRYFALQVKNAAVMSFIGRTRNELNDSIFNYDVFVSYSEVNREWVLDNLLPNLEKSNDLKVCLHERDFQVGLSILENIIASLDRSRCILLVVSLSFVKSQWCQFELHLAQHRLLETRREELILVLLEEIPRSKRPKMLHYLMLTKTYIVWPKEDGDVEGRRVFWKRLRKAVTPCGLTSVSVA